MATLVTYFSHTGNTKRIAEIIAEVCDADVERIEETTTRKGFFGYLAAGRDALTKRSSEVKPPKHDPASYDLVVIGSPVWAWSLTPPVRNYLTMYGGQLKRVAFFCTQGGSGAEGVFKQMAELCSKQPVATLVVTEGELKQNDCVANVRSFAESLSKDA